MIRTRAEAMEPSTFVVSITPFSEAGALDEDQIRAHLRRFAEAGVGVYVGGSGTGEGLTLSRDETFRLYQIAREELQGKVPVRAMGIEPRTAREMIELAEIAAEAGMDAMQVYSVLAPGASPAELEDYFSEAVAGIRLPVIISTHHAVGYKIPVEVVAHLVDRFEHIIGVNVTHVDIQLLDLVGRKIAVHVAAADDAFANLALGGHGFLSNVANIVPRVCAAVVERFKGGDFHGAAQAYAAMLRVERYNRTELRGPRGQKAALRMLGLPGGHPRKPRLPVSPEEAARLLRLAEAIGITALERSVAAAARR